MGLLTLALKVTLDGRCDHHNMVADGEVGLYWTRVMDVAGAMSFGHRTYELMEDAWLQVARDPKATPAHRNRAKRPEAKPELAAEARCRCDRVSRCSASEAYRMQRSRQVRGSAKWGGGERQPRGKP